MILDVNMKLENTVKRPAMPVVKRKRDYVSFIHFSAYIFSMKAIDEFLSDQKRMKTASEREKWVSCVNRRSL